MISLFDLAGARLAVTFNGLTFNSPFPTVAVDNNLEINSIGMLGKYRTATESRALATGSEPNPIFRDMYVLRIEGTLRAPSLDVFTDRCLALATAFDPDLGTLANPSTSGVLPLDFSTLTADTANYASGKIPSRYYVRGRGAVLPADGMFTGAAQFWTAELEMFDPRRYLQTTTSTSAITSSPVTADNTLANYPSWPTIVITMSGAGNAAYTLARAAVGNYPAVSIVIDLSGAASGDTYTIDMQARTVIRVRSGVSTDQTGLKTSAGDWFQIVPGSQALTPSNATNASAVLTWRRAWVA